MALAHVSKPAKVTPGYKRKIKRQVAEITGKLYKTKNYKENYQRIRERKEAKKNRGR
jgi:hypothetical protein